MCVILFFKLVEIYYQLCISYSNIDFASLKFLLTVFFEYFLYYPNSLILKYLKLSKKIMVFCFSYSTCFNSSIFSFFKLSISYLFDVFYC